MKIDNETKFMLYEPGERTTTIERQREFVHSQITSDNSTVFVAEYDNQLVGHLIVVGGKVKRNKHVGYIVVGILKEYTGKGIGTNLFNALENWRAGTGIKRLELSVMVHNEAALSLYQKMGFEIEGIKKNSLIIDGNDVDEYYMGKTFKV
ncbi:Acetyltransferase YpeA [compost metagenome]